MTSSMGEWIRSRMATQSQRDRPQGVRADRSRTIGERLAQRSRQHGIRAAVRRGELFQGPFQVGATGRCFLQLLGCRDPIGLLQRCAFFSFKNW